jgi:hypothetical protein
MITIGIDPGWASFGIAITKDDKVIATNISLIPKEFDDNHFFIAALETWVCNALDLKESHSLADAVYIERFVTYGGVQVDPENILMVIGALEYYFCTNSVKPILIKALDWKIRLCHYIVKTKGLSNPGTKFDKKYSLWAAEIMSGEKFKSDHEADAVCLSYMKPSIR